MEFGSLLASWAHRKYLNQSQIGPKKGEGEARVDPRNLVNGVRERRSPRGGRAQGDRVPLGSPCWPQPG